MLLDDVRVIDLTDHRGEVGPWVLGRLGAEVIKVEPPGGSPARRFPPVVDGLGSTQFAAYNDDKRSVEIDLTTPEGQSTVLALVAGAEIVVESGPPGALVASGITEAELVAANPALVHVLVTPFGSDGPRAEQPATEATLAALGGPMSLQGVRERPPVKVSIPQVWRHTGAEAAVAALVALRRSEATNEAQWVDLSAQAAMTWTMLNAMEADEVQGFDFERAGATIALAVDIDLRRQAQDGYVMIAPIGVTTAPVVPWLIDEGIVGPSWADVDWATFDHRILSGEATEVTYDDIRAAIDELCSRYTRHELLVKGLSYGATIAPVNDVDDLVGLDHLDRRRFWTRLPTGKGPVRHVGAPVVIDGERPSPAVAVPEPDGAGAALAVEPARTPRRQTARDRDDLPLAGVKVADFSWIGVGPISAKCLADHGATVVRLEHEGRLDTLRAQAPFKDAEFGLNRSNFYGSFNTSKLCASVDLSAPAGRDLAMRFASWADVVIDSFRPGTMDRLGLGHDAIAANNPGVITVTTSLLGSGGPLSPLAGYGFHAAALAGFTELVGWPDLGPDGPWMAYTDTVAPRFVTAALLAALDRRDRTGRGAHLEGAQLEIGLQLLAPEILEHGLTGHVAARMGNRDRFMAPQGAYPCRGDDEWCVISVPDDDAWTRLRKVLGDPDWAGDPALDGVEGRQARHDDLDAHLAAWTQERTAEEAERDLVAAAVPAGKVQRTRDLRVDPQYLHRDFYKRLEHDEVGLVPYAGHQYRIRGYDHGPRFAAPCLGQHTYQVLTELLGMSPDEVADATAAGALG